MRLEIIGAKYGTFSTMADGKNVGVAIAREIKGNTEIVVIYMKKKSAECK